MEEEQMKKILEKVPREFQVIMKGNLMFTQLLALELLRLKNEGISLRFTPDIMKQIEEVSKLITRDNNAVLLNDMGGNVHIITKHDIIQAVSKMS